MRGHRPRRRIASAACRPWEYGRPRSHVGLITESRLLAYARNRFLSNPPTRGLHLVQITERVYVIYGPMAFPDKGNQGFMNNPAFVLTDAGVVVIDPGSSVQSGEMVLRRLGKTTRAPIVNPHWGSGPKLPRAFLGYLIIPPS